MPFVSGDAAHARYTIERYAFELRRNIAPLRRRGDDGRMGSPGGTRARIDSSSASRRSVEAPFGVVDRAFQTSSEDRTELGDPLARERAGHRNRPGRLLARTTTTELRRPRQRLPLE